MKVGLSRAFWKDTQNDTVGSHRFALRFSPTVLLVLLCCAVLPAGCFKNRQHVKQSLMADMQSNKRNEGVAECYRIGCPDVLHVEVKGQPKLSGDFPVEPDGRINLEDYGEVRVDGRSTAEAEQVIAEHIGAADNAVAVEVAQYNSEYLLLFGQVFGWQRSVAYQGQETVLDVLQRVGGITTSAAPESVYVVRSHVSEGQRPEIFHVDLNAIVLKKDYKTNIRVQPYDQIYVGETRRARFEKSIPLWLMPAYRTIIGEAPTNPQPAGEASRRFSAWRRYMKRLGDPKELVPPIKGTQF